MDDKFDLTRAALIAAIQNAIVTLKTKIRNDARQINNKLTSPENVRNMNQSWRMQ